MFGLRLDAFAIAAYGPAEPIGMLLTRRRHTTNLTSPARSRRLRRGNLAQ
jgi:hypothetical protein